MEDKKFLSVDELLAKDDTRYDVVETPHGLIKIGSASSRDILDWFDENNDPEKKRFAGLRLLVKCIINPDGSRIPEEQREAYVTVFANRDSFENGRLASACLVLNGLKPKPKPDTVAEPVPNASSEAPTGVSPTDSPSPQAT